MTRRLIVAGSRSLVCKYHCIIVAHACAHFVAMHWRPDVVLSGACKGADEMGEHWAQAEGLPVERYPADWNRLGKSAGPERNQLMVDLAHGLVVVRGMGSRGSADVLGRAQRKGLPVVDVVLTDLEVLRGRT